MKMMKCPALQCCMKVTGVRCSRPRPAPHCRVLPPGELNGAIPELLPVYSDRFVAIFLTLFPEMLAIANKLGNKAIHTALQSYVVTNHSVNNGPVKRLTLVARLPPAFYIGPRPHAGWNYGIVTMFS